jgi:hypothetical protein
MDLTGYGVTTEQFVFGIPNHNMFMVLYRIKRIKRNTNGFDRLRCHNKNSLLSLLVGLSPSSCLPLPHLSFWVGVFTVVCPTHPVRIRVKASTHPGRIRAKAATFLLTRSTTSRFHGDFKKI